MYLLYAYAYTHTHKYNSHGENENGTHQNVNKIFLIWIMHQFFSLCFSPITNISCFCDQKRIKL